MNYSFLFDLWLLPIGCFGLFGWLIARLIKDAEQTFA
jgi:hypothetical protein